MSKVKEKKVYVVRLSVDVFDAELEAFSEPSEEVVCVEIEAYSPGAAAERLARALGHLARERGSS